MDTNACAHRANYRETNTASFAAITLLVLACIVTLALTTGCASQSSPADDSAAADQPTEQASAEPADVEAAEVADQETQPAESAVGIDEAANTQETEEENADSDDDAAVTDPLSEEEVALNNEWADTTVRDALTTLADEGVIAPFDRNAYLMNEAFEYMDIEGGYGIAFLDEAAGAELSGEYTLPEGKVIIGRVDYSPGSTRPVMVDYANGDWVNESIGADVPLFYPESLLGHFSEERVEATLADVPAETFANSTDECDYLVVFDAVDSHVDEDYYMGSIPRTCVTTMVFVFDAKQGKVVHIENLGTDSPGTTVEMGQQTGSMLWDEVATYLNTLLLNRSQS